MRNCLYPGETVWFLPLITLNGTPIHGNDDHARCWLIGILGSANTLAEEAINKGIIKELTGYDGLSREVKYGDENSRIDILLQGAQNPPVI